MKKRPLIIMAYATAAVFILVFGMFLHNLTVPNTSKLVMATADEQETVFEQPTSTDAAATDDLDIVTAVSSPIITNYETEISVLEAKVLKISEKDDKLITSWKSSDESIVRVDDGGRLDGIAEGKAEVTASLSNNKKYVYSVTVNPKAFEAKKDIYSTAITANEDIAEQNEKNPIQDPYRIFVNRKQNIVTVYTYDSYGSYTVPVRAMICSCGKNGATITGEFNTYFKHEWHSLYDGVYGQYVTGISGDFLFHSVPYTSYIKYDSLEVEEFNKLGTDASLGCVRLSVSDAKWIYDHCEMGTYVKIYDSDDEEPLGKPYTIKITDETNKWDPTDSNDNNPYNSQKPKISAKNLTINIGGSFSPMDGVTAKDTCGNDITDKIEFIGNVVTTRKGEYRVTYTVTDALNRTDTKDITINVK